MPNSFISKSVRTLVCTAAVATLGAAIAQSPIGQKGVDVDSIKPAEWTGNLAPSLGSASAPVKIVCFVDYQCPTCRTTDVIVRRAISKRGDIALFYREFPLQMHQFGRPAAIVAENARAHGTFELAHKRLMQGKDLTEASVKEAARLAGVSAKETSETTKRLELDHALERKVNISSTPTFVVIENGKSKLMGPQQIKEFLK